MKDNSTIPPLARGGIDRDAGTRMDDAALELAMADAGVQRTLAGRPVAKVIARLPRMMSLVPQG